MTEETGLVLMPVATPEKMGNAMTVYQKTIKSILNDTDYQAIQGKQYKKKSAWRKIQRAYGISVTILEERKEILENGEVLYHFKIKATAPNGQFSEGVGSCSNVENLLFKDGSWKKEKEVWTYDQSLARNVKSGASEWVETASNSEHNTRTKAETRAYNRAVQNLIGAEDEVSAEEITTTVEQPKKTDVVVANLPPCPLCGKKLYQSKYETDEYYCSGYKDGCAQKGKIADLKK